VKQLEGNGRILEKVVITDDYAKEFLRQYEEADFICHKEILTKLLNEGIIDKIVYAPYDEDSIQKINERWFGTKATITHAANGQNIYPTLFGFDSCRGEYILQMDSDLIIGRLDKKHDVIEDMIEALDSHQNALFVSFNILNRGSKEYTAYGPDGDWRVEVRCSMLKKTRENFEKLPP
jgi:hypothetical protein